MLDMVSKLQIQHEVGFVVQRNVVPIVEKSYHLGMFR